MAALSSCQTTRQPTPANAYATLTGFNFSKIPLMSPAQRQHYYKLMEPAAAEAKARNDQLFPLIHGGISAWYLYDAIKAEKNPANRTMYGNYLLWQLYAANTATIMSHGQNINWRDAEFNGVVKTFGQFDPGKEAHAIAHELGLAEVVKNLREIMIIKPVTGATITITKAEFLETIGLAPELIGVPPSPSKNPAWRTPTPVPN